MDWLWFVAVMFAVAIVGCIVIGALYAAVAFVVYYLSCVVYAVSRMYEVNMKAAAAWLFIFAVVITTLSFLVSTILFGWPT